MGHQQRHPHYITPKLTCLLPVPAQSKHRRPQRGATVLTEDQVSSLLIGVRADTDEKSN